MGSDNIKAEQLKYGPEEVAHTICELLNHMARAAKEAAKKRAFSKHRQQIEENDRLYHFEAYVKGRRLHDLGILRP